MIHKVIYLLGLKVMNPSLLSFYQELLRTDKASKVELDRIQELKFSTLMDFVFFHSPYYREKLESLNLKREDIEGVKDLYKLPTIGKEELRSNAEKINAQFPFRKIIVAETSGTSGQPLKFNKDEEWDSMNRASMFRGYSWYGVKPWDKNGYFWGYNIENRQKLKIRVLDWLQNRFRIFSYNEKEIKTFTKRLLDADYLEGYSSMIYEVAKRINKLDLKNKPKNIKLIKGTSEKIYDKYHEETLKAFGSKIRSEYGAAEAGLIAFECPQGYMHINSENVIVEDVDGEIVVTNLMSKSFPIIRYKLGDKIQLAPENFECTCGRKHPVILDVLGRVGKSIVGRNNSYPSLTFYYVFKNLALHHNVLLNYQAIQNQKGKILLKIEQEEKQTRALIEVELRKYFKEDIEFEIVYNSKLHSMDGKLKDFITTIEQ